MLNRQSISHFLFVVLFVLSAGISAQAWSAEPVDINTATAAEISETLNGIGEKRAQAIVKYRETIGSFDSVEQLLEVKGIGESILKKNDGLIKVE